MATHCFVPLLGKRIRVTEIDSCGILPNDSMQLSTDGFVTLTLSAEVEEGTEIIVRKASGALCVNSKQADSFKRFTVEIEFCGVNPSLLALVTNAEEYSDGDEVIGFTVPEGAIEKWFALELWTGLDGVVCAPGAEEASGYILLPFVTAGVLGDIEVTGEDAITFSMTGAATKGGNAWGVGPYDVYASGGAGTAGPLPEALDPFDHFLMIETGIAPPPEACDPAPVNPGGTPPTVTTVNPDTGAAAGGTAVVITGTDLTGTTGVTFGGTPGTSFSVANPTTINVTAPAHAAGAVAVVIAHPNGNVTKANGYTYS